MQEMMRCKPCTLMKRMQNEYKQLLLLSGCKLRCLNWMNFQVELIFFMLVTKQLIKAQIKAEITLASTDFSYFTFPHLLITL